MGSIFYLNCCCHHKDFLTCTEHEGIPILYYSEKNGLSFESRYIQGFYLNVTALLGHQAEDKHSF